MPQTLFATAKVPTFLDAIIHGTEKRRDQDVKIVTLVLRVQPFGPALAAAVDEGVQPSSSIKPLLFSMNKAEPKAVVKRFDFGLGCPRQNLLVFASADTVKESIAFDQVRIAGTYVRTQKDIEGYAFVYRASFGPVGRRELEFIQDWHLSTRFLSFAQAEPSLEFDKAAERDDDEGTDQDQKARQVVRPLEWEDDGTGSGKPAEVTQPEAAGEAPSVVEREVGARRKMHSHQTKKKPQGRQKRVH